MKEVAADHDTGPALASLAVNSRDVVGVVREPLVHVVAEGLDQRDRRWMVVVEGVRRDPVVELFYVVGSF